MTVAMMGLAELKVNTASVVDGASVAAYVTDSAGNLVGSTSVGGLQSLYVDVTASVLPTGAATETTLAAINTKIGLAEHLYGGAAVVGDTGFASWTAVRSDAGGPLVSDGQYGPMSLDATGRLRVQATVNDTAMTAILQQAITVGTTAIPLPAVPLAGRVNLVIMNSGTKTVFLGSSTVTNVGATRGPYLEKGGSMSLDVAPNVDVYGIAAAAGGEVLILEAA